MSGSKDGRIYSPEHEQKLEPFARMGEEIEWNETLKKELLTRPKIPIKLIKRKITERHK